MKKEQKDKEIDTLLMLKEKQLLGKEFLKSLDENLKAFSKGNYKEMKVKQTKKDIKTSAIERYIISKNIEDSNNPEIKKDKQVSIKGNDTKIKKNNSNSFIKSNPPSRFKDYLSSKINNINTDEIKKNLFSSSNFKQNKNRNMSESNLRMNISSTQNQLSVKSVQNNKSFSQNYNNPINKSTPQIDQGVYSNTYLSCEGESDYQVVNTSLNYSHGFSKNLSDSDTNIKKKLLIGKDYSGNNKGEINDTFEENMLFQESPSNPINLYNNFKSNKKSNNLSLELSNKYDSVTIQKLVILRNLFIDFKENVRIFDDLPQEILNIYYQIFEGKTHNTPQKKANQKSTYTTNNSSLILELQKELSNLRQKNLILEKKNDLVNKENSTLKEYLKKKEIKVPTNTKKDDIKNSKKYRKIVRKYEHMKDQIEELESPSETSLYTNEDINNYHSPRQNDYVPTKHEDFRMSNKIYQISSIKEIDSDNKETYSNNNMENDHEEKEDHIKVNENYNQFLYSSLGKIKNSDKQLNNYSRNKEDLESELSFCSVKYIKQGNLYENDK